MSLKHATRLLNLAGRRSQNVASGSQEAFSACPVFTGQDVEKHLEMSKRWLSVPKPTPGMPAPTNTDFVSDLPVLYDLIALALQTAFPLSR